MEDYNTNKVETMAKGRPRFDGKDKHVYRIWKARVRVHLNMSTPVIYDLLAGQEKYNSTDDRRQLSQVEAQQRKPLLCPLPSYERGSQGKKPENGLRYGQVAWNALEEKHDSVSNATRRELYEELTKTKMKQGQRRHSSGALGSGFR